MYLDYFSLKRFPFRITPDPSLFFHGGSDGRGVVLSALVYAITSGEGIVKVVGEVGSGKTMLCRMLEDRLPETIEIVYLANPSLSPKDIIYAIAFELKLDVDSSTERLMVMHKLQEYLLNKHSDGGSVVVFVEEAQSMPLESLEEIRLLSNLETHHYKLMQIVLFGQPELDKTLQIKSIRQLRERITHSFNLEPLSHSSTREYLRFRLQAAGCPWPNVFTPRAEKKLAVASLGLTRRINILADKALMAAYAESSAQKTYADAQPRVLPAHVKAAIRDSGYKEGSNASLAISSVGLAAMLLLAAVFFVYKTDFFQAMEQVQAEVESQTLEPEVILSEPVPEVQIVEPVTSAEIAVQEPDLQRVIEVNERTEPAADARAEAFVETKAEEVVSKEVAAALSIYQSTPETPVNIASNSDIIHLRQQAAEQWLNSLVGSSSYTIQLASFSVVDRYKVEAFLQELANADLLEDTYLCLISATALTDATWLVIHGEFSGLSMARKYIAGLPASSTRQGPYVRNVNGVACVTDTND